MANAPPHYAWLWDVAMSNEEFDAILAGQITRGAFDTNWALVRLIEYAPWRELKCRLPRQLFVAHWPAIRNRVRSAACREGMEFVYARWHGQL
jgi:hypothetical protein